MEAIQNAKAVVRDFHAGLDAAKWSDIPQAISESTVRDCHWRCVHPFNEQVGSHNLGVSFWQPFRKAFQRVQRRQDILMAGHNRIEDDGTIWVVSMGHLMGLFDAPWLDIPPTRKMEFLRYCEFYSIEDDHIREGALFCDIPDVMMRAGVNPFPPQSGSHVLQPGPLTHDGVMMAAQPEQEGEHTLRAIDAMVDDLRVWNDPKEISIEDELRRSWSEDMIWWGPAGIGATYTIERYVQQHAGPFRAGFVERRFNGHVCKIAEGRFGGFFGWPNLTLRPAGGFMGMPATGKAGDMRVIDIYRRDGDKLAENWVFIDLLHFWNQQGVDVLARSAEVPRT